MRYLRERFNSVLEDTFLTLTTPLAIICIILHAYQFINSGYNISPLIRLIFCAGYPIVVFFIGRRGCYWYWWVYGNVLACQTTFQNYTAFIIIVLFTMMIPKMKFPSMVLYTLEIFAIATYRDKTPVHILIHISNCIALYYALIFLYKPKFIKKRLELTIDEAIILDELLKGKNQKEIEQFSQNTVTNKLKSARKRNNVATTDELLIKYKEQIG